MAYPGYPVMAAPIPNWPAVVIKPETVSGIRSYQTNLILDLIFSTFALLLGLSAFLVASSDFATSLATAALSAAASCGLLIVFVINFIVSLISVTKMHHGADEYGPEHAKYARRGVLFKWLGTSLSTTAAIMVVYMVFALSGLFFFPGQGEVPAQVFIPLVVTAFWTAGVTCKGQMYRYMVRALQPSETRGLSDIASYAIPVLGLIGLGVVTALTVNVINLLANPGGGIPFEAFRALQMLTGAVFLPAGFAIVGYAIFVLIYGQTVKQLQSGLQQLQQRLMAQPMWPMGAPFYAPPPAAPPAPPPVPASIDPPANLVCPECGRPGPRTAAYCQFCGAKFP